jgi:catechol 2,3-dioxygenase-like lactoylglutathione lyase family enzyme
MDIKYVSGFAPVVRDMKASLALYRDALALPLENDPANPDYYATSSLDGAKHFGLWPLEDAAQSCFGTREWPSDVPVPQATIEFEVDDVAGSAAELEAAGYELVHGERTEPWGQVIARVIGPEGLLIGLTNTSALHD